MEKIGEIFKTTDYDMFEFHAINRKVDPHNLARIVESMKEKFLITVALVLREGDKLVVWDGQHRLKACEFLDKPYYFSIMNDIPDFTNGVEADTMAILQNSKHWVPNDYINHWAKRENPSFVALKNFMEETGLPAIASVICLSGNTGVSLPKKFRQGIIKIENIDRAYKLAEILTKFKKMGFGAAYNPRFISAIFIGLCQHTISLKKLYDGIEVNPRLRWLSGSVRDTLENLKAYSHKDRPLNKQFIDFKNPNWIY